MCSHFPHGNKHVITCLTCLFFASCIALELIHEPRHSLLSPSLSKNSAAQVVAVYEHELYLLEDTIYHCLVSLWPEFSCAYAVFDQHGPDQLLDVQQVWEALLTVFPLKHKHMQTVLLDREIRRLMA